MRGALAIAGVCALVLLARTATAAPVVRLVYQALPESCADEEHLRAAVVARVGFDPFAPDAKKTIVARLSSGGRAGFVAVSRPSPAKA